MTWKLTIGILAVTAAGGAAYVNKGTRSYVVGVAGAVKRLAASTAPAEAAPSGHREPAPSTPRPWDHLVPMDARQQRAIGLRLAAVEAQAEPIRLELHGTTAYDPNTLTTIRPRFDCLVKHVFKTLGSPVKKGDPLIELYSNELATAKNDLQVQYVQWLHDRRLLLSRQELNKTGAISNLTLVETQNSEAKSHLEYRLARDKLLVFGVPQEEIESLLAGLNDESLKTLKNEEVSRKASMTLRAPADGIIVRREVVEDNLYEPSSVLMVIAPLDHLLAYGNVYESDIDKVEVGQDLEILFPFLDRSIRTKVENISNQVDPETHAMRIRTTIENPGGRLKADMLVRMILSIPPTPGCAVVPRNSVVMTDDQQYVFVKKVRDVGGDGSPGGEAPDLFERRKVGIKQERSDRVIVGRGLAPGEQVVTNGSLIMSQIYEDLNTVDAGTPL